MSNLQHEWRWIIALAFFFLERDMIMDVCFAVIEVIIRLTANP